METDIQAAIKADIAKLKEKLMKKLRLIEEGSNKGTKGYSFYLKLHKELWRTQPLMIKTGGIFEQHSSTSIDVIANRQRLTNAINNLEENFNLANLQKVERICDSD